MKTTRTPVRLYLGSAVILSLAAFGWAQNAGNNEDQPRMQNALQHLQQAEEELRAGSHDKGGHRVKALQLVNQATQEVKAGIEFDDTHQTGSERRPGTPGNDQASSGPVRITSGPTIERLDDNNAVIAWGTNVQGSSRVEYGTNRNDLTQLAEAPWGASGLTHRVTLNNLKPDTTYYFDIETAQARGSGSEVEGKRIYSFRTLSNGSAAVRNQQPR